MQYPHNQRGRFSSPKRQGSAARGGRTTFKQRKLLRVGSLCTGYGGLDMAVMRVFGAKAPALSWVADNSKHASTLLKQRFGEVRNLGDLLRIDWRLVDPVDMVCAGFPCQDISFAGHGAGIAHCIGD